MKAAFLSIFEKRTWEKDSLNGLRAISMICIFVFHLSDPIRYQLPQEEATLNIFISNLTSSVDLFFILSGFLIYGVLYRGWEKTGTLSFKEFYLNRSLRIFPAYYFFVFLTLGVNKLYLKLAQASPDPNIQALIPSYKQTIDRWIYDALYISNYKTSSHFHTWSLSLEEQFYLVFPLICYFILFKLSKKPRLIFLTALYSSAALIRYFVYQSNAGDQPYHTFDLLFHRPAHTRFDSIVAGILTFELYKNWNLIPEKHDRIRELFFLIPGIVFLTIASFVPYSFSVYYTVFRFNFSNLGYAMILTASIHNLSWIGKFLSLRIFTPLARISYGTYLWHIVAIFVVSTQLGLSPDRAVSWGAFGKALVFGFFYALLFAFFSYMVVEYPFLNWKNRLKKD
ncbi:acyltransferase [Leptospira gomenensis]|uniref:Acyltransferase n=1 Tax=Leptospira gomenensis TaxID=2484974 RepID=A0A5F1YA05_9LEPT|nr:acyltransferase [Leptospira gomenensis]TGK32666.1 acyltransferase [Leptospira gomenensis]TGK36814.1 acyltransferase [Leptospira gomenensis]TGK39889.1 acyltransferase [Leptospira gomenensis]TGK58024.1 acyltransferase [Leptospira gomenensis]